MLIYTACVACAIKVHKALCTLILEYCCTTTGSDKILPNNAKKEDPEVGRNPVYTMTTSTSSQSSGSTNVDVVAPMTTTTTSTTARRKILITGASGYLGQHLLASLCNHDDETHEVGGSGLDSGNYEVYAVYHQMKGFSDAMSGTTTQFQIDSLDLTDPCAVDSYFDTYGPFHTCLHLAALSSPAICEKEPEKALALNVPKHFLHKLIEQDCFIIATSTDQVYGGTKGSPYMETDPTEPLNMYAKTKVLLEEYLLHSATGINSHNQVILLRSSILLGPPAPFCQEAHDTFLQFCQSRQGQVTTYYTDECRSVLSVHDAVRILRCLLANILTTTTTTIITTPGDEPTSYEPSQERTQNTLTGIYNMGGPHRVSRYDMALAVHHHPTACNKSTDETILAARKQDQPQLLGAVLSPLDITMTSAKLEALVGFEFMTLSDIVDKTFAIGT